MSSGEFTIRDGSTVVGISPSDGGRLTSIRFSGVEILAQGPEPLMRGCYPMVPWCGRIRNARFPWRGEVFELQPTDGAHALHGIANRHPWDVIESGTMHVTMHLQLAPPDWPWSARVIHDVTVVGDVVICILSVESLGDTFPAQVGWHPCFIEPSTSTLDFARMYRRDADGITSGVLVAPDRGRRDDCFVEPTSPLTLRVGEAMVRLSSECSHWVVYDAVPKVLCVEPQSGPPNGFNIVAGGDQPAPFDVVAPGAPLCRRFELSLSRESDVR